jgi:hypothetical protein
MTTQKQNIQFLQTLLSLTDSVEYSSSNQPHEGFFQFVVEDASIRLNSPLTNGIKINISAKNKNYAIYIDDYTNIQKELDTLVQNHYYKLNKNISTEKLDKYLEMYKNVLAGNESHALLNNYDVIDFPNTDDVQIIDHNENVTHIIQLDKAMSDPYSYETTTLISLLKINVEVFPIQFLSVDPVQWRSFENYDNIKIVLAGYEIHKYPCLFKSKTSNYIALKDPLISSSVEQLMESIQKDNCGPNFTKTYNYLQLSEKVVDNQTKVKTKYKL